MDKVMITGVIHLADSFRDASESSEIEFTEDLILKPHEPLIVHSNDIGDTLGTLSVHSVNFVRNIFSEENVARFAKLRAKLEGQIKMMENMGPNVEPMNEISWQNQFGVLISGNDAKLLVDLLNVLILKGIEDG